MKNRYQMVIEAVDRIMAAGEPERHQAADQARAAAALVVS